MNIIFAFTGSLCAGILLNVGKKRLLLAGLSGALGYSVYYVSRIFMSMAMAQTFLGALAIGLYSEVCARKFKSPATVYSIPGIIPLVPGVSAYNTIKSFVEGDTISALSFGVGTILAAVSIAFGIALTTAIFRKFHS